MEQPRVVPLSVAAGCGAEAVGPKAYSLLCLMQAGMTVPEGFCITAEAHREHMNRCGLDAWIQSRLGQGGPIAQVLSDIRQAIGRSDLCEALKEQIRRHYEKLKAVAVAVRSSATAEDLPGHSFAGQYETFLDVLDFKSCLEAVKKCWASVWTDRAFAYRQKNGMAHQDIRMAVIVQRQIEAQTAGVLFTADPVRGRPDRIVIEACRGLGEALVSGKVTPDEMIFAKRPLKPIWILPADLDRPLCLDVRIGRRLAKAGRKIEKLWECPQDIEWAVEKGRIYFLQARPVTVRPVEQAWEDRQIWTNTNTGEVAPDVVTPLDWSIIHKLLLPLFKNLFYALGIEIGNHPVFGLAAGRVYFNFNTGMAFLTKLPSFLFKPQKADVLFGGGGREQYDLRKIRFGPDDLPDLKVSIWKILRRLPRTIRFLWAGGHTRRVKILELVRQADQQYGSISFSSMTPPQRADLLEEICRRTFVNMDFLYLGMALAPTLIVVMLCRKWLQDQNRILAHSLLKSAGDMEDVRAGLDLADLAQMARRDPQVLKTVQTASSWQQAREILESSPAGRRFLEAWSQFMDRHGHHCRSEILLYNPRWAETPDYILRLVRSCLEGTDQDTPARRYQRQVQQQEDRVEQILRQLTNPFRRWILKKMVDRARKGLAFRENIKSGVVRLLYTLRRLILDLGQAMQANRQIAEADDIFFLEREELRAVIEGTAGFDVARVIQQRRSEYERWKKIDPPQVIIGRFDPDQHVPRAVDADRREFHGMSVCPGKVTGKARVILRSDDKQQVLPGEILVAPFTDPGWTPYFINAAGIVMDQGGLLSHGSIVAREFGIPAVVNVGPATKIIRTGQILYLDADQGKVSLVESS